MPASITDPVAYPPAVLLAPIIGLLPTLFFQCIKEESRVKKYELLTKM